MKNKLFSTINSGKYKGKKILLPSVKTTRSTKSIIKGSFFDTIQFEIIGKIFIEVFAGSGSIGFEALSKGAKRIYFIEKDIDAYKILLQNIKSLDANKQCKAINADSFIEFIQVIQEIVEKAYFYFDPPFEIREGMDKIYQKVYDLIKKIPKDICKLIVIEHMSNIEIPTKIGVYQKLKSKKFGKTAITYFN